EDYDHLIVRLDQMSRNEDAQDKLCLVAWDLVVFDEAHKLSAHFSGREIARTKRFNFAEKIGQHTRHLLLLTATPHNGKEEDFQLFLSLLDSDRFYGRFRDGVHKVDASDLIRRMVKEEMVKFDGTPLFPERKAYTVNYTLSDIEAALYESVTHYVKTEMGKAEEQEKLEETLVDQATAARTIAELEQEIILLRGLEHQARAVVASGQDRKWDELSRILQNDPAMRDAGGRLRKLILFSEHRDT